MCGSAAWARQATSRPHPPNYPACPIPAALGQLCAAGHPVAGAGVSPFVPRTCAAVRPPRAGTPGGVGPVNGAAMGDGEAMGDGAAGAAMGDGAGAGTGTGACAAGVSGGAGAAIG